jgi:hypothetical protein
MNHKPIIFCSVLIFSHFHLALLPLIGLSINLSDEK